MIMLGAITVIAAGLTACGTASGTASGPAQWCWHWWVSSDGVTIGNSLGSVSCSDGDTHTLILPSGDGGQYTYTEDTHGYAEVTPDPSEPQVVIACALYSTGPHSAGWIVFSGDASGQDGSGAQDGSGEDPTSEAQNSCSSLNRQSGDMNYQTIPALAKQMMQEQQAAQTSQADQQAATDISNAQSGDSISDYSSDLSDMTTQFANDCIKGEEASYGIGNDVDNEETAIINLQNDVSGTSASVRAQVQAELNKANATISQVVNQANTIIGKYPDCSVTPISATDSN